MKIKTVPIYEEQVESGKTTALFVALALAFLGLLFWRWLNAGPGFLTYAFLFLSLFFVFYALNYRRLAIRVTPEWLELRFGLFTWRVPLANIEGCTLDGTSLWRIGGAGIHFSWFNGRYRAMLNFLEHPRVVVALKRRQGPVRDVAFSTRQPEEVLTILREAAQGTRPARPSPSPDRKAP